MTILFLVLKLIRRLIQKAAYPAKEYQKKVNIKAAEQEADMTDGDVYYKTPENITERRSDATYGTVETVTYYSTTVGKDRSVTIVLPPNYTDDKKYPVVYLCHGLGQDNTQWTYEKADVIIGNLIADGEAKEMILVLPNCRARKNDEGNPPDAFSINNYLAFDNFYNDFKNDLKPFIESNYSVKTGRENTAIAGFSMGGRVALHLGLGMQDIFGYVAAFCPAPGIFKYTMNNVTEEGLFTRESFKVNDEYKGRTLVTIVAGKSDMVVFDHPECYHNQLEANGTEHIWYKLSGGHDFNVTGKGFYNFAKELFK